MKKEYVVIAQQAYQVDEKRWTNIRAWEEGPSKRAYSSLEDAKAALGRYIEKFNKDFRYDKDGKRRENHYIGGGFGADVVVDKKLDDSNRVVAWKIKVRQVSEWEEVEADELEA